MRRRLLALCLLAYPREVRERDGDALRDLALDLAAHNGTVREGLGLIRGGWAERRRLAGRVRRAVTVLAVGMGTALAALTWTATAQPTRVEEDRFSCTGDCRAVEAEVAARVRGGWTCDEIRASDSVTWRCTLD